MLTLRCLLALVRKPRSEPELRWDIPVSRRRIMGLRPDQQCRYPYLYVHYHSLSDLVEANLQPRRPFPLAGRQTLLL